MTRSTKLLVCLLLLFDMSVQAQDEDRRTDFYGNSINKSEVCKHSTATYSEEAERIVKEILDKVALEPQFGVTECPGTDNCKATLIDDIPYIIIDRAFLEELKGIGFSQGKLPKGERDWNIICILAHEVGHHLKGHINNPIVRRNKTPREREIAADEFAGFILYKMGASLKEAQSVMYSHKIPEKGNYTHPPRQERLAAIKRGYDKAKAETKVVIQKEIVEVPIPQPNQKSTLHKKRKKKKIDQPVLKGMVFVQGGTFTMGCTDEQGSDCDDSEKPAHEVYVSDFYIGKYEVTVGEFKKFVNATGYKTAAEKLGKSYITSGEYKDEVSWRDDMNGNKRSRSDYNHPVIHVSWDDANAYAKWKGMRLPTEAEWEYAARGGSEMRSTKYAGSSSIDDVAWYSGTASGGTKSVGTKTANELGIYDMSGNVSEWCEDFYSSRFYQKSINNNPINTKKSDFHVLRGGNWLLDETDCRVANRSLGWDGDLVKGFRLAADL